MNEFQTLAAVDLGSNSFRLEVARVVDQQIYPLDSIRDPVRLAAGLDADKHLTEEAQSKALACLARFGERLRGLQKEAVRVVGTSALRVARNSEEFLSRAECTLGFPIEVVAGREEARLIYLGVAHGLPATREKRLVVDIGGGSTECIIGEGLEPIAMESLHMGCVNFSMRFFPTGRIDKASMKAAEFAARAEVQTIAANFARGAWIDAVGSSGTARALATLLQENGLADAGISYEGLDRLKTLLLKAGHVDRVALRGLKDDRRPVLAGGFAIMSGIFGELSIARMGVAEGAMREGILYDMLGRAHHQDMRDVTVAQFMRRYGVDTRQATRVARLARQFHDGLLTSVDEAGGHLLEWAGLLHETGLSISHSGYHRHGAYVLANADMPGFSREDQARLALLVRAQRGGLYKVEDKARLAKLRHLVVCLRLAVLFNRARREEVDLPLIRFASDGSGWTLGIKKEWLARNPLTDMGLAYEAAAWREVGGGFTYK